MPKSKKELAAQLLEQILEVSSAMDAQNTSQNPDSPKGEGWMTFHLKKLKELIEDD
jgi:hypothetical protein